MQVMSGTLIFDGECGFCTRTRDLLARLDRRQRVKTVPFQSPGVAERAGISRDELATSVYWLDEDGSRYSGAQAANAALSAALGNDLPLRIYRAPGMRRLQEAVYRWVSNNRHRLPGTTPWCTSHPDSCG
jgi:predicted DCC family thiol-disulfide oxidoreductase YuxK